MNINNIPRAVSSVSLKSQSFTTKQQINPQELKYTKTKRKPAVHTASTWLMKTFRYWSQNPTITVHRTRINVCICLLEDDSMQWDTRPGRIVSSWPLGLSDVSRVVNDCAFPRGCPESPDKRRLKSRLSPKKRLWCDHLLV